jgi:hypothetical protein
MAGKKQLRSPGGINNFYKLTMKKHITFLFLIVLSFANLVAQNIEDLLFELPDVIFKEVKSIDGYEHNYELHIKQPIDHSQPAKGYFYQKVFLSHKGFDRPTVIVTEGYDRKYNSIYEISKLLDANQIDVEHRYFGDSKPDSLDYNYLNLKQVSADLHHINQLFKKIYKEKWISTGISKGGATTVFYRYFYPDDVDISMPYVAPINNAYEDKRIYKFLNTAGTETCRKNIISYQRKLLENRDKILPKLHYYSKGAGVKYTYLTIDEAFEFAVLEYSFSFWQSGISCDDIPSATASLDKMIDHLIDVSNILFFSDASIAKYGSHYYQAAEEMGYYGYETNNFKDLLKALPVKPYPYAALTPNKISVEFDNTLLKNVNKWLKSNSNKFIYIYGASDTWSATAVPESDIDNSVWFFMDGKHHYNARIRNMDNEDYDKLVNTLENWLSLTIENNIRVIE